MKLPLWKPPGTWCYSGIAMRYAVLADIHSNLAALQAVWADLDRYGGVDGLWCLGDIVGYGPDPGPCLEQLRERSFLSVAGNHDLAAVGRLDLGEFNSEAAQACRVAGPKLDAAAIRFLGELPLRQEIGGITLVHGSPRGPVWEYLLENESAAANFACFHTSVCLVGHSHIPLAFHLDSRGRLAARRVREASELKMGSDRFILNPGSVGQPRDGDPRASYAIYDRDRNTVTWRRVAYDIRVTQARMREAKLPPGLIDRLDYGL
jgi:diadenosine tetraphosphatase ApaH/serine/threonine PP2A family protein phosphatase